MLRGAGLAPLALAAKEGLALINGTQVSTALALHALFTFEPVLEAALVVGALTVDAARGSDGPFDPRIHELRGQPGQIDVARYYRALLAGSEIRRSHLQGDDRVQDPYSLRCQPQVVGACLDQLRHAALVLVREANAVTDNPLVFAAEDGGEGSIISGGNFHAEPVALAADAMAVAIAEVGAIAERRIAMLIDAGVSRLPPFLSAEPGLNSGFMIAHVTAASLASENKSLAHPASVDSLPTSANQEDHVSMATFAARRLQPMIANTAHILAIELLAAAQGIEFLRPLASSPPLEAAHALLRGQCAAMPTDRYLAPDIERATALVRDGCAGARPAHGSRPAGALASGVNHRTNARRRPRNEGSEGLEARESGGLRRERIGYKPKLVADLSAARRFSAGGRRRAWSTVDRKPDFEQDVQTAPRDGRRAARARLRAAGEGVDRRARRARRRDLAGLVLRPGARARRQGDAVQAVAGNARPAVPRLTAGLAARTRRPTRRPLGVSSARRAGTVLASPRAAARERPPRCG